MSRAVPFLLILALAAGGTAGYWWAARHLPSQAPTAGSGKASPARKPLYYRHPMNPAITSPVPAKDEMGMDYIPVYAEDEAEEVPGTVKIDPVIMQDIGVRTARAERRTLSRQVYAVGRVDYDEERLARLHPKTEGWVEELFVDKTGEPVSKDTILLGIYSPQLVTAQQEYLLALDNLKALERSPYADIRRGAEALATSARTRLEMLDVPEHQIRELERSHQVKKVLHIHSPFDGIVVRVGVRDGQYVTPRTELYQLADIRRVWVYVDVFENELPWIREGDPAEMRLKGIPGKVFRGRVSYIYPFADEKTRTIKVRLAFDNPRLLLRPGMFADVTLFPDRRMDAVAVPAQAVVRTGTRDLVFVVRAPGRFEPRQVRLGVSAGGWVQILEGLRPGEEVVTSATFLIDSESSIREAAAKMLPPGRQGAQAAAGPPGASALGAGSGTAAPGAGGVPEGMPSGNAPPMPGMPAMAPGKVGTAGRQGPAGARPEGKGGTMPATAAPPARVGRPAGGEGGR
ncbi:MAG: efflux RND transporter periplasmic adaptor subunit [Gammaproteobacteria bacterium]|nr:MAG: efflux RND transporter periplasmic adaptor subunit [Gammaproteobacteria bacterium]